MKNIKRNELYTVGEVLKIYHVKGNRTVDFKYFIDGKTFTEFINGFYRQYY